MATDIIAMKKCSVCGKEFVVPYPELWTYRSKGSYRRYQCSYKCYRKTSKPVSKTVQKQLNGL